MMKIIMSRHSKSRMKKLLLYSSSILALVSLLLFTNRALHQRYLEMEMKELQELMHMTPYNPELPTNWSNYHDPRFIGNGNGSTMNKYLLKKFANKSNGFFVESGAFDGHYLSNTIALETAYGWSGLLVEADPIVFPFLKWRNRRAWVSNVCLSPEPYPIKVNMTGEAVINTMIKEGKKVDRSKFTEIYEAECFPLPMLLKAIGRFQVDYLSLDIEGLDLDVLKTIPFNTFDIKLISVETDKGTKKELRLFLESVGYKRIIEFNVPKDNLIDDVYEREETEAARQLRRDQRILYG